LATESSAPAPTGSDAPVRILRGLAGLAVAVGCLLRFLRLDADPDYYGWWGHVFDEGRWVEQARHLALHGTLPDPLGHNALVAPLYEVATTAVFVVGGVSFTTARIFSALCGSALVVLAWLWLRGRVRPAPALLGVSMLAFPADLVVMSRIAAPESAVMLGTLLAFGLLCTPPPRRRTLVGAGVVAAVAVGLKLTALFVAGVFLCVALVLRGRGATASDRLRDAIAFAAGVAGPAAVALLGAIAAVGWLGIGTGVLFDKWAEFMVVRDVFSIFSLLFALDAPAVVASCLALWLAGLVFIGGGPEQPDRARWLRAASAWAVIWIGVYSLQGYFPSYYRIHVLVPLALVAALATDAAERSGWDGLHARLVDPRAVVRWPSTVFVAAVPGLHLAAVLAPAATLLGESPDRISIRLLTFAFGWAVATLTMASLLQRRRALDLVIAFSVAATVLHFAHWIVRPYAVEFFARSTGEALAHLGLLAGAAVVAWAAVSFVRRAPGRRWAPATAAAGLTALAWGVHLAPGLLAPAYTMRDASRSLPDFVDTGVPLYQHRAETLFIENRLAYRPFRMPDQMREPPVQIVTDLPMQRGEAFLARHYALAHLFEAYVPEGHHRPPLPSDLCPGPGQCFGVFRRIDAPDGAAPDAAEETLPQRAR
jgi:hypothetical protein